MTTQNTATKRIRITQRYGAGTFVFEAGRSVIGCVTRVLGTSDKWLCDVRKAGRFATLPIHSGSLLSALRFVKSN